MGENVSSRASGGENGTGVEHSLGRKPLILSVDALEACGHEWKNSVCRGTNAKCQEDGNRSGRKEPGKIAQQGGDRCDALADSDEENAVSGATNSQQP